MLWFIKNYLTGPYLGSNSFSDKASDKTKQTDIWFVNYAQPELVNHFMSVQQILSAENKRAFFYYFFALVIADNLFDNAAL